MIVFSFYSHFTHWFKKDHFGFNHLVCPSVPLFCYTCVFPAISPLDCIRFPLRCPPGQVCLSSRAVGEKGEGASCHWKQNSNESKLRKRTEKDVSLPSSRWVGVWLIFFLFFFASLFQTDVSIELYSDFQETSVWCCMRKAASCLPCVESRVKNTPWDSTSPSPMNAATHICATELQHPLPPTGLPHCSHYLFHTQFGE